MPWGEAVRLVSRLKDDPTSHVGAVLNEWDRPWSFEWAALADLYDLTQYAHVDQRRRSQVKPYPRPWRAPGSKRRGRTNKSRAEVLAILNAHGHNLGG